MQKPFKRLVVILIGALMSVATYAQVSGTYYVSSSSLNLRSAPTTSSEILERLDQYTNVEIIEDQQGWAKISVNGREGYVSQDYLKKGRAVVELGYRTGARCRDGSYSSATGRGACSHHGGVANWIYKETVRIEQ